MGARIYRYLYSRQASQYALHIPEPLCIAEKIIFNARKAVGESGPTLLLPVVRMHESTSWIIRLK